MRVLIALIVWAAAIAGGAEVSKVVASSIHNKSSTTSKSAGGSGVTVSTGSGPAPAAPFDPSSVTPTSSQSLFVKANLSKALATAKAHLGSVSKVEITALYPGYVVITAARGGTGLDVDVEANGTVTSTSAGSAPGLPAYPLSRVAAGVPAALLARVSKAGVPASQVNYMVAESDPVDHKFRWLIYPKQGNRVEYFQASGAKGPLFEYLSNSSTGLKRVKG